MKELAEATPEMLEKWAQVAEVDAEKYTDPHTPDAYRGLAQLARAIAKCTRHSATIDQEEPDYWWVSLEAPHGTGEGATLPAALASLLNPNVT